VIINNRFVWQEGQLSRKNSRYFSSA